MGSAYMYKALGLPYAYTLQLYSETGMCVAHVIHVRLGICNSSAFLVYICCQVIP